MVGRIENKEINYTEFYKECKQLNNSNQKMDWNYLYTKYGFKTLESARGRWKNYRKKNGMLPQKEEKRNDELENKLNNIDIQKLNLEKEKVKVRDQKRELRKMVTELSRYEYLQEVIRESANEVKNSKPFEWKLINRITSNKEGILLISDWHSNLEIDNYLNTFNQEEFKRRINRLVEKTIEHGKFHNIKTLHVMNLNDMISGTIHVNARVESNEDNISQIMFVSEIISEMMIRFSNEFEQVNLYNVTDNHSRISDKKDESIDKENLSRIIPWYVETRVSDYKNIKVLENILDDGIASFEVCGHLCLGSHGDKDQITNATNNLPLMFKMLPEYIFLSHFHHLQSDEIHSCEVIVNPSLAGVDSYSFGKRKSSKPAQMFMIFNEEEGRECSYSIRLDR